MLKVDASLNRIRIASPCSVGWENMSGDDRVRFCDECSLHVYNISEMTAREAHALVTETEGRICARFYRRADGTILTKDCPVGLKALRRRISRTAGAALTAVLTLCTVAFGQSRKQEKNQDNKSCTVTGVTVKREAAKDKQTALVGVLTDFTGAFITGARVTLSNQETKAKVTATSNDEGIFSFSNLPVGKYTVMIEAAGFSPSVLKDFEVKQDEVIKLDAALKVAKPEMEVMVGMIVTSEPSTINQDGSRTYSGDMLRKLPINE